MFPCPRSRLRIWSRETGSAVPSRVRLLVSILMLNLVLTYEILPEFHGVDTCDTKMDTAAENGRDPVSKHQIQTVCGG